MSGDLLGSGVKMFVTLWLLVFLLWAVGQLLLAVAILLLGRLQEQCIGSSDVTGLYTSAISICRSVCIYYLLLVIFWQEYIYNYYGVVHLCVWKDVILGVAKIC